MKYAIVFDSVTGNTEMLATKAREVLGAEDCLYFGCPDGEGAAQAAAQADLVLAGSWVDKGTCSKGMAEFMASLGGKKVFLFGTCGFGGSQAYFDTMLGHFAKNLPETAHLVGQFMCQGKMPAAVRKHYELMLEQEESEMRPDIQKQFQFAFHGDRERVKAMIDNFDVALVHPTDEDLQHFAEALQ